MHGFAFAMEVSTDPQAELQNAAEFLNCQGQAPLELNGLYSVYI